MLWYNLNEESMRNKGGKEKMKNQTNHESFETLRDSF